MKKFSVFVLALLFFVCLSLLGTCTALQPNKPVETEDKNKNLAANFILLGATGNLAEKYLWQSLFNIYRDGLSHKAEMFVYPSATSNAEKAQALLDSIFENNVTIESDTKEEELKKVSFFEKNVFPYHRLKSGDDYEFLNAKIDSHLRRNNAIEVLRVFYLSVPPKYFAKIAFNLKEADLITDNTMIIVEKPFGSDLSSAQDLAANLFRFVPEGVVQLVDHYMGKRGMTALRDFRYYNDYIGKVAKVEVCLFETEDVSGRGWFYRDVGVLRDTMQNHMMMMLSLFGADLKTNGEAEGRLRFVKGLHESTEHDIVYLGQYSKFKQHLKDDGISSSRARSSKTPTYAEIELHVLRNGSALTPDLTDIVFKSGKALDRRTAYIKGIFEDGSTMVFNIQGKNNHIEGPGLYLKQHKKTQWKLNPPPSWVVEEKKKNNIFKIRTYRFDPPEKRIPGAYETLLRAAFEGDATYFVNLREVLKSWNVFQGFLNGASQRSPEIYKIGSSPHDLVTDYEREHDDL